MSDEEVRHSPEPWGVSPSSLRAIEGAEPCSRWVALFHVSDGEMEPEDFANRDRIILCVNALAGIPSAAIAAGIIADFLEERGYLSGQHWLTERDRMAAEIERLREENVRLSTEREAARGAMRPFFKEVSHRCASFRDNTWTPDHHVELTMTIAELRAIHAAFKATKARKGTTNT